MKTLVLLFIACLSVCLVAAGNHNRHYGRKTVRNNEDPDAGAEGNVEWPSPGTINDFTVPDEYTGGAAGDDGLEPGGGDEIPPARHHGKNHHRSHKN